MTTDPQIPYGYRLVQGQLQKGDGIWNGERFAKAKKEYPYSGNRVLLAIRRCEVVQPPLPGTEVAAAAQTITVHYPNGESRLLNHKEYDDLVKCGMMWEFHPDAPHSWPEDTLMHQPLNLDK